LKYVTENEEEDDLKDNIMKIVNDETISSQA